MELKLIHISKRGNWWSNPLDITLVVLTINCLCKTFSDFAIKVLWKQQLTWLSSFNWWFMRNCPEDIANVLLISGSQDKLSWRNFILAKTLGWLRKWPKWAIGSTLAASPSTWHVRKSPDNAQIQWYWDLSWKKAWNPVSGKYGTGLHLVPRDEQVCQTQVVVRQHNRI